MYVVKLSILGLFILLSPKILFYNKFTAQQHPD